MKRPRFSAMLPTISSALGFLFLLGCGKPPESVPPGGHPAFLHVAKGWPYPLDAQAATGENGMVVSDAPIATQVGVAVLKGGGNAVDATVATAFALAVVLPGAGNIGGGGLIQGEANAIVPGKRMLSAMTPTIVMDEAGRPLLVTGAAGGPFIITTVFQLLSDCIDYHMGVATATNLPRIHHQHLPDELRLEKGGFDDSLVQWLQNAGHKVKLFDLKTDDGSLSATIERRGNLWFGQSDPRLRGLAKGY